MNNLFLIWIAIFMTTPVSVEARSIETQGMCELKAKSRYSKDMKEISKVTHYETRKSLAEQSLKIKLSRIESCKPKVRAVAKVEESKAKEISSDGFACSEDYQCQMDKIEAMTGESAN
jgi:hypothetical protein